MSALQNTIDFLITCNHIPEADAIEAVMKERDALSALYAESLDLCEQRKTDFEMAEAQIARLSEMVRSQESALAQLQSECRDLTDQLARVLPSETSLRDERDTLQRRIHESPVVPDFDAFDSAALHLSDEVTASLSGKCVALVVLPGVCHD